VQAGWLGYAFTTGLPSMDFILADAAVLPEEDQRYYSEQVCHLPDFYLLAGAPETTMAVSPAPMLRQGYPTFGSFNNPAKISPAVYALWGQLLRELPEARLLFKNKSFADINFCRHVTAIFAGHGVAANRLSFEGQAWGDAYFESFSRIDVALDTFPFPGLMTSLDTLWMGVPVVGLRERAGILGRHGARLLELIGHGDWVASEGAGYLARVKALVADGGALNAVRSGLRDRLRQSPVMAADRFVQGFEEALLRMAASRGIHLAEGTETI
jgi:predicted O-linked N-acetylglucosamine transferase (SPINDLY family)